MKKRATKKSAAKPRAAKKASVKAKKPATKKPVARAGATPAARVTPYTLAPIKSDGWPPFRYPLQ